MIRQYRQLYPSDSPGGIFFAITTASGSWRGQLIEAKRRAGQPFGTGPTWVYVLDWRTPVDGGRWGAPLTLDIPLAFNNVGVANGMTGTGAEARRLAAEMSDTWIAFARTGNPNHAGLPEWTPYNPTKRPTPSWRTAPRIVFDPRGAERRLVEQVPYTQPGT